MLQFTESILQKIKLEISLIWTAHKVHKLEGQMRVYTCESDDFWKSDQPGLEIWFGSSEAEIDDVVEKIGMYYRKGNTPNSPVLLDPIVYEVDGREPTPIGSGMVWNTIIPEDGAIPDVAFERLKKLGVHYSFLESEQNPEAGIKVIGWVTAPMKVPEDFVFNTDGNFVEGMREIYDLVDVKCLGIDTWKQYVLSGLEYRTQYGRHQHADFPSVFNTPMTGEPNIKENSLSGRRILDAGMCWNAYGRDQRMYERYGIDPANLENNLKGEDARNREIQAIKKELQFIWKAHQVHGLDGKMKLFTDSSQKPWRAKTEGVEVWFGPDELDKAADQIRVHYNAGLLPNSPLLLDPIVYKDDGSGNMIPVGSGITWASIFCIGKEKLDEGMLKRFKDTGLLCSTINRGGLEDAGIKVVGLLDQPYLPEEGRTDLPGQEQLFGLGNTSGEDYWRFYILSGLEYLCAHGSFMHRSVDELLEGVDFEDPEKLKEKQLPMQRIYDAAHCWDNYDRHHSLWERFGIDTDNLESNLRYFNLCARDFELLDATNTLKSKEDMAKFELICNGWVPRSAITLMAATGGTGKSSMAHNLCVKAAIDYRPDEEPPIWLGSPLNLEFCQGMCVYFTGEDGPEIVNSRADLFDPEGRAKRMMFFRTDFGVNKKGDPATLNEHLLENLWKLPDVSIVVIDPARKYLTGDEDDAEVVSHFFEAIEEFAISKKCAMVVVHHLSKGAKPQNSAEVLDCLRGSQVFIDRPRVVIGMNRDGAYTLAGLAKNNIPPQLDMVQGDRVFVRDPDKLDLIWLPGEEGVRNQPVSNEELRAIKEQLGVDGEG